MHPAHKPYLSALIGLSLLILATAVSADRLAGPGTYDLSWNTIDGGGGTSAGGTFALSGTIGQPDAGGPMTGGTFSLTGGFWPGAEPAPVCAGDIATPHNNVIDADDLLVVIQSWGTCPGPCPPNYCAGDCASPKNCFVDADDLLVIIQGWGNCPPPP